MSDGKPSLLYFNVSGRAFAIRVAMYHALGKDGWHDERLTFQEFGDEKKKWTEWSQNANTGENSSKIKNNFGYLPELRLGDGRIITQSAPLARYYSKLTQNPNLYPTADYIQGLEIDEVISICEEALNKCPQGGDPNTMKERRLDYMNNGLHKSLKGLVSLLKEKFFSGDGSQLTLADLFCFMLVDMILVGMFDHVPKEFVEEKFPELVEHGKRVRESEIVKGYYGCYEN